MLGHSIEGKKKIGEIQQIMSKMARQLNQLTLSQQNPKNNQEQRELEAQMEFFIGNNNPFLQQKDRKNKGQQMDLGRNVSPPDGHQETHFRKQMVQDSGSS